jgi:hypothetical protein
MQIINFLNSLSRASSATDRLIGLSYESHRSNLKKSLTARLASATAQGNLALIEQLKLEAQYLDS